MVCLVQDLMILGLLFLHGQLTEFRLKYFPRTSPGWPTVFVYKYSRPRVIYGPVDRLAQVWRSLPSLEFVMINLEPCRVRAGSAETS